MNLKLFLGIGAVISVLYGAGFILIPNFLLTLYGIESSPAAILGFRYFGLTLLTLGIAAWVMKESSDWTAIRGLLLGLVVGDALGVIVSAWATLAGVTNAMGWSAFLIYLVFALAYGYFLSVGGRQPASA
jgi:hypothetical protein